MLVLASASPRRAELLRNAAIPFRVHPAHIPEQRQDGESPADYAMRLAREKAETVWRELADPGARVLGADTVVVLDEHVLEKPLDTEDAERMLRLLSGRTHEVTTGVCLTHGRRSSLVGNPPEQKVEAVSEVGYETTRVTFSELNDADIRDYVRSGEPMDKAGAYAIQGIASRWAIRLEGCYFNVVGLPVPLVWRMLNAAGDL